MIRRPATILALLTGLNLLNYLDRLVVSAVLPKMQEELGLTNFVGGLLATVFLVGYFVTAPAFGFLGDRWPRRHLIAFGVLVWSAATIASGLAGGKGSLIAARSFVGVGEAAYATLAPTVIDDITPPKRKGRALAVFYAATPVGAALGYLVGGQVEKFWGWRRAFFVAGVPGVLLAFLCLFMIEPERKLSTERPSPLRDLAKLAGTPLYRRGVLGYCAYTAAVGGFSFWAPKFLYARHGMSLAAANTVFGGVTIAAGLLATFLGGFWADRIRLAVEREVPAERQTTETVRGMLRLCAIGSLVGAPLAAVCFLSPSPTVFFVFVFLAILALFLSTSPINAILLSSVPPELRASAMALAIFAIHVLGDLWSPPAVGLLADHVRIDLSMMLLPVTIAASAWLWWPPRERA